jgi:hypothetical protein
MRCLIAGAIAHRGLRSRAIDVRHGFNDFFGKDLANDYTRTTNHARRQTRNAFAEDRWTSA